MPEIVGRFAPSPTGPLHFGSVVAAVASWLDARSRRGAWLVRIDDLDPPREQPGAARTILDTLAALALEWDGAIVYQSARSAAYRAALADLEQRGLTFACGCSRRDTGSGPYPGTCRDGLPAGRVPRAQRVRIGTELIVIEDRLQGRYAQRVSEWCGDFVVRRADGLTAYHLAAVVDDAAAGVNDIVRGIDLLESAPRQVYLQALLGVPRPRYAHVPVVLNAIGNKLSKQTGAPPVLPDAAPDALFQALAFLGLEPPASARGSACPELLDWAIARWDLARVPPDSRTWTFPA